MFFKKTICKDTSHPVAQFLINYIFYKQSRISAIELGQESGRDVSEKEEKKPISWIVAYKYVLQGKGLFINYVRENRGRGSKIPLNCLTLPSNFPYEGGGKGLQKSPKLPYVISP